MSTTLRVKFENQVETVANEQHYDLETNVSD